MTTALVASITAGTLTAFGQTVPASFGRAGATPAAAKREGDGKTPLGTWPLRAALLRPDRVPAPPPTTALPWRWLRPNDAWSDDPADPAYNRPVRHPHPHSAEKLWRDDAVYDLIIILGHNDTPPIPDHGSAIFLHATRPDRAPTEGCVAVASEVLTRWLPRMQCGHLLVIGD